MFRDEDVGRLQNGGSGVVMIVFSLVRVIFTKHDNKVLSSKFSSKVVVADNIRRKFSTSKLGMAN